MESEVKCPKCGSIQMNAAECSTCGVIFSKIGVYTPRQNTFAPKKDLTPLELFNLAFWGSTGFLVLVFLYYLFFGEKREMGFATIFTADFFFKMIIPFYLPIHLLIGLTLRYFLAKYFGRKGRTD